MYTELQNKFKTIVEANNVEAILPFLKELSKEQKRELVKTIKILNKYYSEFIETKKNSYSSRGTAEQHQIIRCAEFVCYTGAEYKKSGSGWMQLETLEQIFQFYKPEWFSDYVNERARKDEWIPFGMSYDSMMKMKYESILEPCPELIVKTLPQFIFDSVGEERNRYYVQKNEKLLKYSETLNEHIWLFFEMESNIHWASHYVNYGKKDEEVLSWQKAFKHFADEGRIDRRRIITFSLRATNLNFNKLLTGWFIALFETLLPTESELLKIQGEMMSVFNCPHSKPINTILKYFKKICLNNKFNVDEFINHSIVLLSNETKSIVNSTLMVLDKLAKKHKSKIGEICKNTSQALLHSDSGIQSRAAKIIAKYGNKKDEELSQLIHSYLDNLLLEAKNLLDDFINVNELVQTESTENEVQQNSFEIISDDNIINYPGTIDDLMFFSSQAFDNNAPIDFEILPAALLMFSSEINDDNIIRFEPALQRALKLVTGDGRSGLGNLDHMLAIFFIEYIDIMIQRFPAGTVSLKKMLEQFLNQEEEKRERLKEHYDYGQTIYPIKYWDSYCKSKIYQPFKDKLSEVLDLIKSNIDLPLLSTPTHHDFWVNPDILIKRMIKWQEKNVEFKNSDFQFALTRLYLFESEKYLSQLEKLEGEPKEIMRFILLKEARPIKPFVNEQHWWTAAITKAPQTAYPEIDKFSYSNEPRKKYTGDFPWRVVVENYKSDRYDYNTRKYVKCDAIRKELRVNLLLDNEEVKGLKKIFSRPRSEINKKGYSIYEKIELRGGGYENDIKRFYSLCPNNPEKLIGHVIHHSLKYPEFWGEDTKRMFLQIIDQYITYPNQLGPMGHLITAGGMICSDKTARILVGELWNIKSANESINNKHLGKILGTFYNVEFAPLKRFTDLITENLYKVSQSQNMQLQLLIENMFMEMNDIPIKGLKKLLEIYLELLNANNSPSHETLDKKFTNWQSSKSLGKVLKDLTMIQSSVE